MRNKDTSATVIVALSLFACGIILILWGAPHWEAQRYVFEDSSYSTLILQLRQTWAQIIGGVLLLCTVVAAMWRARAVDRANFLAEEGQITTRISTAIEHLGDDRDVVVMGGVQALRRVARDSPGERFAIWQILVALVRRECVTASDRVGIKAQTALEAIGDGRVFEGERGADFSRCSLLGLRLQGVRFVEFNFSNTDFTGAVLRHCEFIRCEFHEARLAATDLRHCEFVFCDMRDAVLEDSVMWSIFVEGTNFTGARMGGADLSNASIANGIFNSADLRKASLANVSAPGARFAEADLRGASFARGDFRNATFAQAKVGGNEVAGANFENADLLVATGRESVKAFPRRRNGKRPRLRGKN